MQGKQFAVLHAKKGSSSGGGGLGAHIDRKNIPPNADPEKQDLNEHHIRSAHSLNEDIQARIKDAGCNVRSNSVKSVTFILTGSHDRMKEIESDPQLYRTWVRENRKFLEDQYGKENIIRFAVHRDERTPHIHCVITPITEDGRLSAREIIGDRKKLQKLQDDYADAMKKFGLHRGLKGTKAKHYEVSEYYARIKSPVTATLNVPEKKFIEKHDTYQERVNLALKPLILNYRALENENKAWKQRKEKFKAIDKHLSEREQGVLKEYDKLKQELTAAENAKNEYNKKSGKLDDDAISIGRSQGHKELLRVLNNTLKEKGAKYQVELTEGGRIIFKDIPTIEKKPEIKPRENQKRIHRGRGI